MAKSPQTIHNRKLGRNILLLLLAILLVASVLRFVNLSQADVLTDEGSLGFRAVGFLDFLASPYQTTPLEWINNHPWWFSLSFHDHPIGFFILENLSFKLLGESVFALRLPSAIFGVLTILMLFLIGRKLSDDKLGLFAAALLAVNDYHTWVSRLGLQEAATIFFTSLAFWLWLKSCERAKYLPLFGLAFGAALMIKLHAVILIPLIILYALIFGKKQIFKQKHFYLGLLLAALITAPYWLYNLLMYARFGHFDFQFSYLFGQKVDAWQIRPGRFEFPDKAAAFKYFFLNLKNALSPAFLIASVGSIAYLFIGLFRRRPPLTPPIKGGEKHWRQIDKISQFLLTAIVLYFLFFLLIGPSTRFLTLLVPWLCLLIAFVMLKFNAFQASSVPIHRLINGRATPFKQSKRVVAVLVLFIFFAYELFFSVATNLKPEFAHGENLAYSHLTQLTQPYGYNQLESALNEILAGKKPAVTLPINNTNLNTFVKQNAERQTGKPAALMIIYHPRLYGEAVLWFLSRRMYYQGWPVIDYDVYHEATKTNGPDFFKTALGLADFYYIAPAGNLPLDSVHTESTPEKLAAFEQSLRDGGAETRTITNSSGQPVFTIYHF